MAAATSDAGESGSRLGDDMNSRGSFVSAKSSGSAWRSVGRSGTTGPKQVPSSQTLKSEAFKFWLPPRTVSVSQSSDRSAGQPKTLSNFSESLRLKSKGQEEAEPPDLPEGVPSLGSVKHPECTPCVFAHRPSGCAPGANCTYCHFEHEKISRVRLKKAMVTPSQE
ncbi:unnamed protein product [Polarella glacialis]|uniref:C3H1-type domain-containing protein n=1 Tax=Polarella glacialis TaxID=89957 RepID=A0A813G8S6_POLGL|nr:unnamed protein product [Polarella glacialis]